MLAMDIETIDGVPHVHPAGEVGLLEIDDFKSALRKLAKEGHQHIIIDGSQLNYIFSEGLGVLVELALTLQERGGKLVLQNPSRRIAGLINATTLDRLLIIESTEE